MKRIISLASCVALAMPFFGTAALGASAFNTKLTIQFSRAAGRFSGRVSSPNHACVVNRKVTVYRTKSGPDPAVGADMTSAAGRWRVKPGGRLVAGDYYAKTPSVRLGAGAGTCSAAKSVATHAS
jgi:hypothetical protein